MKSIDEFHTQSLELIEELKLPPHHYMMAVPKLNELTFWLRAGAAARRRYERDTQPRGAAVRQVDSPQPGGE